MGQEACRRATMICRPVSGPDLVVLMALEKHRVNELVWDVEDAPARWQGPGAEVGLFLRPLLRAGGGKQQPLLPLEEGLVPVRIDRQSRCLRANSRNRSRAASSGPIGSSSTYLGSAATSRATACSSSTTACSLRSSRSSVSTHVSLPSYSGMSFSTSRRPSRIPTRRYANV